MLQKTCLKKNVPSQHNQFIFVIYKSRQRTQKKHNFKVLFNLQHCLFHKLHFCYKPIQYWTKSLMLFLNVGDHYKVFSHKLPIPTQKNHLLGKMITRIGAIWAPDSFKLPILLKETDVATTNYIQNEGKYDSKYDRTKCWVRKGHFY